MLVNSVVLRHDYSKYLFSIWLLLTRLALNSSQSPRNREFNFGTDDTGGFFCSLFIKTLILQPCGYFLHRNSLLLRGPMIKQCP